MGNDQLGALLDQLADVIADRVADRMKATDTRPADEYLTPKQTAARLGVSAGTLESWRRHATGPAFRRVGRQIRYTVADLDAYAASRKVGGRR